MQQLLKARSAEPRRRAAFRKPLPSEKPKRSEEEQKRLDEKLIGAALYGNNEEVARFLAVGANVNAKDSGGQTALMKVAFCGHTKICKLLVEKGADVNTKGFNGWTALMQAAFKGRTETCKFFIKNGAELHAKDNGGHTALMWAVGDTETAAFLKEAPIRALIGKKSGNIFLASFRACVGGA